MDIRGIFIIQFYPLQYYSMHREHDNCCEIQDKCDDCRRVLICLKWSETWVRKGEDSQGNVYYYRNIHGTKVPQIEKKMKTIVT